MRECAALRHGKGLFMTTAGRAETWATEQAHVSQVIQFPEEWPEVDRRVSGEFVIEAILDHNWAKVATGFVLINAVVTTPIERRYAQVEGEICFENCTFQAEVVLPYANFARRVRFLGCIFKSTLNLQACRVPDLDFGPSRKGNVTVFQGEANFFTCEVTGQLFYQKAQFLSTDRVTSFNSAKISGNAFFQECIFQGPIDLGHAEIRRNLVCQDAKFLCDKAKYLRDKGEAIFNSIKVSDSVFFDNATFKGSVDLGDCTVLRNISLVGTQFSKYLNFSHTSIGGTLYIFSEPRSGKDIEHYETMLPPAGDLRGLTYDRIDLGSGDRWQTWLKLRRNKDSFDPSPYLTLESYFHQSGRDDLADKVHYEMRKAQGQAFWKQGRIDKWILNCLLRWTVGYGVYGWRLFVWAGVVLIPAWLFFVVSLKQAIEPDKPVSLLSLIYTMDVFLPVNLNQEELYTRPGPVFAIVKFVTKLWGWVIVPLAMAQLAGFLKKKR